MKSAAQSPSILSEEACFAKLRSIHQEHLFNHWPLLTAEQKEHVQRQITALDSHFFNVQRQAITHGHQKPPPYKPLEAYCMADNPADYQLGKQLAKEGKVALVVLAGGQGSRIGCVGPKGCYEVTLIKKKSLFQFLAEKVKAASEQVGRPLEMALMTSPLNHVETQNFFSQHAFFGLNPSQVSFFQQEMWPLLDSEANLFLEGPDQIAYGPNGNGGIFHQLVQSNIWKKWHLMGIEQINLIPIDNPLADPFDYQCCGLQVRMGCEIVIKAALRTHPQENVGVIAEVNGHPVVIEYFEMEQEERCNRDAEGQLKYKIANLGLYTISMNLIQRLSTCKLPLHFASKRVKKWKEERLQESNAWKFEEFIFDCFPFASKLCTLIYPKERCFAPLKNLHGKDSIEDVHKALLANDYTVLRAITGFEPPPGTIFELSPQFYYPTAGLIEKWKKKPFPKEEYIHD
jgi:UDP-N-acetylglucosamine/UDP-N-acetylgalactosamine diphosphorylase